MRATGYRFTVPFDFFPAPFPPTEDGPRTPWAVEAWVGDRDQVLRRIEFRNTGTSDDPAPLEWRTAFTLTLSDFEVAEAVEPPAPAEVGPARPR